MSVKPIVAIVGRPNVGKSTLFNRLLGERIAIVEDRPGVTRDRLYGDCEWNGREFIIIDTGGIEFNRNDSILTQTANQAKVAMEEADVIIFVLNFQDGVTSTDEEIAALLRKTNKPVLLAVNKGEGKYGNPLIYDFYSLGLGDPILISSIHGIGTGDLLQAVVDHFPDYIPELYDNEAITVSLIGRPNVGKSSLVNALIGQDRVIVSDIAGTTRDAIDTVFEWEDEKFVFIDTAGIRKKSKVDDSVEYYSLMRSLRAVERSKVTLIVIDASAGVTEQDKRVAGYAHEKGNALILVVNKWDLIEKETNTMKKMTKQIKEELLFMNYAPVIFLSALTKQRVHKLFKIIVEAAEQHSRRIKTSILNEVIREATMLHAMPSDKGRRLKLYYATQIAVEPPTIALFVNDPELMHFSYMRYLENSLREAFGFEGTPINLTLRQKND